MKSFTITRSGMVKMKTASFYTGRAARMVISYLLRMHMPNIDEYITHLEDYSLLKSLDVFVDDEGLVTLDKDMELRDHALILPARQIMLYPHQFLRRFYSANFVNMPSILQHSSPKSMEVK